MFVYRLINATQLLVEIFLIENHKGIIIWTVLPGFMWIKEWKAANDKWTIHNQNNFEISVEIHKRLHISFFIGCNSSRIYGIFILPLALFIINLKTWMELKSCSNQEQSFKAINGKVTKNHLIIGIWVSEWDLYNNQLISRNNSNLVTSLRTTKQ